MKDTWAKKRMIVTNETDPDDEELKNLISYDFEDVVKVGALRKCKSFIIV